jgi:hypothetical protein
MGLFGEFDPERGTDLPEKPVRKLQENARTVTGIRFAAAGAAMIEVDEDRKRLANDLMGLYAFHVNYEPDAAGIVLELRIIETLLFGETDIFHVSTFC